jgi:hypothetical protein
MDLLKFRENPLTNILKIWIIIIYIRIRKLGNKLEHSLEYKGLKR